MIMRERHQAEMEAAPESARVAQLTNEVEKRDALIMKLKSQNESLMVCVCMQYCEGCQFEFDLMYWHMVDVCLHVCTCITLHVV